jgi:uncharacterized protein
MASMDTSLNPNGSPLRATSGGFDRPAVRLALAALGWISLVLGIATLFVPLFPTTIFLLLALWALSQSSAPGYRWLREHPRLGPAMRQWDEHRVIAPRAKVLAIASLASSGVAFAYFSGGNWTMPAIFGVLLVGVAIYIATRPSDLPDQASV